MKKMRKKIAIVLALVMGFYAAPDLVCKAAESTWKIVEEDKSVVQIVYDVDGECFIGNTNGKYVLADSNMNLLFQGYRVYSFSNYDSFKGVSECYYEVMSDKNNHGVMNSNGDIIVPLYKGDDIETSVDSEKQVYFSTGSVVYNQKGKKLLSWGDFSEKKEDVNISFVEEENVATGGYTGKCIEVGIKQYCEDGTFRNWNHYYFDFDGELIKDTKLLASYGISEYTSKELREISEKLYQSEEQRLQREGIETVGGSYGGGKYSFRVHLKNGEYWYYFFDEDYNIVYSKIREDDVTEISSHYVCFPYNNKTYIFDTHKGKTINVIPVKNIDKVWCTSRRYDWYYCIVVEYNSKTQVYMEDTGELWAETDKTDISDVYALETIAGEKYIQFRVDETIYLTDGLGNVIFENKIEIPDKYKDYSVEYGFDTEYYYDDCRIKPVNYKGKTGFEYIVDGDFGVFNYILFSETGEVICEFDFSKEEKDIIVDVNDSGVQYGILKITDWKGQNGSLYSLSRDNEYYYDIEKNENVVEVDSKIRCLLSDYCKLEDGTVVDLESCTLMYADGSFCE